MGNYLCFIVDYGPGDWGKVAPPCSGQLQSPINIVSSLAEVNTTHNDLVVNFDNMDGTVTGFLINNGHAPKVIVDNNQGGATVTGGPLGQNMFILQQFHFHFGCNSSAGSEHTLDGKTFASEVGILIYISFLCFLSIRTVLLNTSLTTSFDSLEMYPNQCKGSVTKSGLIYYRCTWCFTIQFTRASRWLPPNLMAWPSLGYFCRYRY